MPTMQHVKYISHYLRSGLVSIHSVLSLAILKTQDKELKQDLEQARDTILSQELARIDLLYYSLLPVEEYDQIIKNFKHAGIYKNVHTVDLPTNVQGKLEFLLPVVSQLVDKLEIEVAHEHVRVTMTMEQHNDNALTVELLKQCLQKLFPSNQLTKTDESWGYTITL